MDPGSPASGAWGLYHWTTREVPHIVSRWCGLRKERPLHEHKAHAACHDVSSLSLTQESDVFCWHVPKCDWVNMLHCKQGGKNLRLFTVLDTSTPDFVIHLNTVIFEKKNLLGEPYLPIFHLYFIFGLEWQYLPLCWYKMKVWAAELIQITFVPFPWRVRL